MVVVGESWTKRSWDQRSEDGEPEHPEGNEKYLRLARGHPPVVAEWELEC